VTEDAPTIDSSEYRASNKIITREMYEAARQRLRVLLGQEGPVRFVGGRAYVYREPPWLAGVRPLNPDT
jgi:hypothetical protein